MTGRKFVQHLAERLGGNPLSTAHGPANLTAEEHADTGHLMISLVTASDEVLFTEAFEGFDAGDQKWLEGEVQKYLPYGSTSLAAFEEAVKGRNFGAKVIQALRSVLVGGKSGYRVAREVGVQESQISRAIKALGIPRTKCPECGRDL